MSRLEKSWIQEQEALIDWPRADTYRHVQTRTWLSWFFPKIPNCYWMRDTFFCLQSLQSILEKTQDTVVELFGLTGTQGFHLLLNGGHGFGGKHPIAFRPYRLSRHSLFLVDNFYPFGRLPTFNFEIHFLTCSGHTVQALYYRVHRKLYAFEGLKGDDKFAEWKKATHCLLARD